MQQPSENLLKAIAVTAELTGTELSKPAATVMAMELAQYPEHKVLEALAKCRRELRGRMSLADIISRIDDGRPGPEEAWAMIAPALNDERVTIVVTEEMMHAFCLAASLHDDHISARMAFKEAYAKNISTARDQCLPVKWRAILGHDPLGREAPLLAAVEQGRLGVTHVRGLLPHREDLDERIKYLETAINARLLSVQTQEA